MTVNSYLTNLANAAIIRDQEKESISRSISTLQIRLNQYFSSAISKNFIFGSYSRGTILPRVMDAKSDVDYMMVFADGSSRPQTYLNRLRRFVDIYYSRSEIAQSNPTIVLSLNHIRFELVPAINNWSSGLQIPAKASDYKDWMSTDPTGFNQELINANQAHNNLIKPLIRLIKYWNTANNYLFESYALEQEIVRHDFGLLALFNTNQLKDYFFNYIERMNVGFFVPKWKQEIIARAKQLVAEVKSQESQGYSVKAEVTIKRLLPQVGLLV